MTEFYPTAIAAPRRSQWEANSGTFEYSQRYNCGPTQCAFIAGYVHNSRPGIEDARRLVTGPGHATTYAQQEAILDALGVPATIVDCVSLDQLDRLTLNGRRPIILAMQMGRVPLNYRGYLFDDWHSVTLIKRVESRKGWKLNDSNFHDPSDCRRFYPDWVLQYAFLNNVQSWAIVPHNPKKVRVEFNDGTEGAKLYLDSSKNARVFAVVRSDGIYHVTKAGNIGRRLSAKGHNFAWKATVTGSDGRRYARVRGYGRKLFIRRRYVHFVR